MREHAEIFLAGNSKKNQEWIERVASAVNGDGGKFIHEYEHWKNESGNIDFELELKRIKTHLPIEQDYDMVTKSAGAVLALMGIKRGIIRPDKLICIGLPFSFTQDSNIKLAELVRANPCETLYIQAEEDPMASASEIMAIVPSTALIEIVPGNDHDYGDINKIAELSNRFLGKV